MGAGRGAGRGWAGGQQGHGSREGPRDWRGTVGHVWGTWARAKWPGQTDGGVGAARGASNGGGAGDVRAGEAGAERKRVVGVGDVGRGPWGKVPSRAGGGAPCCTRAGWARNALGGGPEGHGHGKRAAGGRQR